MDIRKIQSAEVADAARDFILNKKHGIVYCVHDKKSVCITPTSSVDETVCVERGYEVIEMERNGGTFILSRGDIGAFYVGRLGNKFIKNFAFYLIEKLKENGLNACFDGNDVLVDGYKVCGFASSIHFSEQFSVIHVGINTNLDDIKAICTKPMVKVPKGLGEYGITAEEIEKWFLDYCEEHKNYI